MNSPTVKLATVEYTSRRMIIRAGAGRRVERTGSCGFTDSRILRRLALSNRDRFSGAQSSADNRRKDCLDKPNLAAKKVVGETENG